MAEEDGGGGGGNVFTRKIGPLPMWGWMGIALAIALAYYFLHKKNTASTQAAAATNTPGGTDSSLVPQFVNQTYTNVQPPAAPNVTVNNNEPAPTSTGPVTPVNAPPAYGAAGTANNTYQAITPAEASVLMSNNNAYNVGSEKAQRPFIWNGSAYVPNTNPISSKYQYYAGPLETTEINKYVQSHPTSNPPKT